MTDLLQHPAIQSALAPFVLALIASLMLNSTRQGAWIIGIGILTMATLVTGLSINFESLTSFNKLLLVSAASLVLIPLIQLAFQRTSIQRGTLALFAGFGALWMSWRVLQQSEGLPFFLMAAGTLAFAATLVLAATLRSRDPITANTSAIAMGLATAGVALVGASITLAFIGIAVAAAAGAHLLVQLLWRKSPEHNTLSTQAALICALAGLSAVLTGQLKWYALLPILLIPLASCLFRSTPHRPLLAAVATGTAAMIPALLAVGLAWWTGSGPDQ